MTLANVGPEVGIPAAIGVLAALVAAVSLLAARLRRRSKRRRASSYGIGQFLPATWELPEPPGAGSERPNGGA